MRTDEITFRYLRKDEFDVYAPRLFALMRENMSRIAPSRNSYGQDYVYWCKQYGGAFKNRKERKIVLIETLSREFVGFFGYCAADGIFLMEEIQLALSHRTRYGIFRNLYGFVLADLPKDIRFVEAYAHKTNEKSIGILSRLGLAAVGENEMRDCFYLRGEMRDLLAWFHAE